MFSFEIAQLAFSTPQQCQQGPQSNIKVMVLPIKQLLPVHGLTTMDISHVTLFLFWGLVHSPLGLLYLTNHLVNAILHFPCGIICAIQWYQVHKFCLHCHLLFNI